MAGETLVTPFDDKPYKFIFKSLVREVSEEEGRKLCLNIARRT